MSKTILVLHGMTMSGASMLRCLGPLASELQQAGFELLAPNGGHQLSEPELNEFMSWIRPMYEKRGRDVNAAFRKGVFWDDTALYDWLRVETNPKTGIKTYRALEKSLEQLDRVSAGRNIVGVIAFSQGAILATLLEALGAQGDTRFPARRFGLYIAGSAPTVHQPVAPKYPIDSPTARMLVLGGRDPFFDGEASLERWAAAFTGNCELFYVPRLPHVVPSDAESVARMMDFVRSPGD